MRRPPSSPRRRGRALTWCVRGAFAAVLAVNVTCALQFAFAPASSMGAYGLSGTAGEAACRGMGVAFLMWNATYPPFVASPTRFPVLGWVILAQQAIGLAGEAAILAALPAQAGPLPGSILRFIAFDGAGLVVMALTFGLLVAFRARNPEALGEEGEKPAEV